MLELQAAHGVIGMSVAAWHMRAQPYPYL